MINLERLYEGFINSYNSLLLSNEENLPQETHAIIEWFRRTGISMGFYPYCEHKRRDLEWYSKEDDDKSVLHLESENTYGKFVHTVDKLIESDAIYRVGLLWTNRPFKDITSILQKAKNASKGEKWNMLMIIRFFKEEDYDGRNNKTWRYPIKSWLISKGTTKELKKYYILWPKQWGYQTTEIPDKRE